MLLQLRSALVGEDGLVQLDLPGFEPPHDLLEFGKRILETHRRDVGGRDRLGHPYSSSK